MRWIIAALLLVVSANVSAQPAGPRGYVLGGLSVPWQQGVTSDEYRTYLAAPGGWSTGLLLGGGAHLTDLLSLQVEWRRTGLMETVEPSRYFITYSARRRDTTLAVGARIHLHVSQHLTLEPVGMFEFVREQSWLAERRDFPSAHSSATFSEHTPFVNSWGTGLGGGIDMRVGGRHLAALPGVRVHRIWRGDRAASTWPGGLSNWSLEIVAAGRLDF